ncbi:DciA family protein [uncultured Thiodictyon sp.]|uniref:DciA family protein n=1 Tax=uncultured Thiodictyon sp. TaxID=1846217 RepID=UPI0025E33C5A|nr:DciA family protein [uncultured Thiodictyon sp.]
MASPAVAHCLELQQREDGLLTRVRELLAPAARPHCIQASATDGQLTVTVDSAAWATRLRYAAPDLARGLADAGVVAVKLRARPQDLGTRRQTPRRLDPLTPAASEHLLAAAQYTADAGIAEVFRRLAARRRERDLGEPFA